MNLVAQNYSADLALWMPRLLGIWRLSHTRTFDRGNRLTSIEASQIASAVEYLSQGLTRGRELAGARYFSDPLLLGAYLLYFWPQSYLQARHLLALLPHPPKTVLDLGSGPGPVGAAALDAGAVTVTFADRSRTALTLAQKLATLAKKKSEIFPWDPLQQPKLPAAKYDCIFAGHLLNELWAENEDRLEKRTALVISWFQHLQPGGTVVLFDPALTSTSRDLIGVRDRLRAHGAGLLYPCLQLGTCPALNQPAQTCHLEQPWELPPLVNDLVRRLKFKKAALKMTAFIFTAPGSPLLQNAPEIFRIVSEPLLSKNRRRRLLACGAAGRLSLALKPELATPENQIFLALKRGDLVRVTGAAPRAGGLDLVPGSRVEILPRPRF